MIRLLHFAGLLLIVSSGCMSTGRTDQERRHADVLEYSVKRSFHDYMVTVDLRSEPCSVSVIDPVAQETYKADLSANLSRAFRQLKPEQLRVGKNKERGGKDLAVISVSFRTGNRNTRIVHDYRTNGDMTKEFEGAERLFSRAALIAKQYGTTARK